MQLNSRLRNKIDTSSQWTQINPVILDGELIFVKTSDGKIRAKMGDGVKTYTQLPFLDEDIYNYINSKIEEIQEQALLPPIMPDDNGKFLSVVEGKPLWIQLPIYNGEIQEIYN